MKLSLITVTYNSLPTLKDTVASVVSQCPVDLEYIVIDGASTDGTVEWLKGEQPGITKWLSENDHGIYDAMNKGLKLATGDLVGFIHADDLLAHPNVLRKVVQFFKDEDADLVYGDLEYITKATPSKVVRYWKSGVFKLSKLSWGWMPPHPTVYFKRSLLETVGYFNTSYLISADYDWMLRALITHLKVAYFPTVMVQMRIGGASNRSIKNIIRKSKEDYRAIKANDVGCFLTLIVKNLRKLEQFIHRKNY